MNRNGTRRSRLGDVSVQLDPPTVDAWLNPGQQNAYRVTFYLANGRDVTVTARASSREVLAERIQGMTWWVRRDQAGDVIGQLNLTGCDVEIAGPVP